MHVDLNRLALQSALEIFFNPHIDSWILSRSPEQNVNMVFPCIDIETPELFLGDRMNGKHAADDTAGACFQGKDGSRTLSLFPAACPG